jgi:hypothetical protein
LRICGQANRRVKGDRVAVWVNDITDEKTLLQLGAHILAVSKASGISTDKLDVCLDLILFGGGDCLAQLSVDCS